MLNEQGVLAVYNSLYAAGDLILTARQCKA